MPHLRTIIAAEEAYGPITVALRTALQVTKPEEALAKVTEQLHELLGDKSAPDKPGSLKPGEHQFTITAVDILHPNREHFTFMGQQNFPAHQKHQQVPASTGHLAVILENEEPLRIDDLHSDPKFVQVLSSAAMGSLLTHPMKWRGEMIGFIFVAAQARGMYRQIDASILASFADVATAAWVALQGPERITEILLRLHTGGSNPQ